jgi:uncharacterized protein (TIGR03435 family)
MKFLVEHSRFQVWLATLLFLLFAAATAQQPVSSTSFEVASVKQSPPNHGMPSLQPWGSDTFSAKNVSLDYLLQLAFGKHPYEIAGEPKWIGSEAYDVDAKAQGGALLTWRTARGPLQNLLRERFQLKSHYEQKAVSGYELVISSKTGHKLKPVEGVRSVAYVTPGSVHGENVSFEGVSSMLSTATGSPVVDRTGINGLYDFDIRYAASPDSNLPDLFTAIQEQLGLRLQPAKLTLDVLVIDHVDRIPTSD